MFSGRPRGPLRWLDPGAFGTLGVGGGFALGAKLCRPESELWIIYGDGSFGYSAAEIDTFTRHKVGTSEILRYDSYTQDLQSSGCVLDCELRGQEFRYPLGQR